VTWGKVETGSLHPLPPTPITSSSSHVTRELYAFDSLIITSASFLSHKTQIRGGLVKNIIKKSKGTHAFLSLSLPSKHEEPLKNVSSVYNILKRCKI
jgi:hypothetical protein